jgi:P-type Cu2+ transporter
MLQIMKVGRAFNIHQRKILKIEQHRVTGMEISTMATETAILQKALVDVQGMQCAGCSAAVEKQLLAMPGVASASVNLLTALAVVEHSVEVSPIDLAQQLTNQGFPSQLRTTQNFCPPADPQRSRQLIGQLSIAITLLALSVLGHVGQSALLPHQHVMNSWSSVWWHWGLATIALAFPGRFIVVDGLQSLLAGRPNMHTLVGLGASTAYLTSMVALIWPQLQWECFFDEPVMLVGAMLLGKSLEQYAKQEAAREFSRLLALQPPTAHLVTGVGVIEIPVAQLKVGEQVQVLPGECIPVDGQVLIGQSAVDEALLTGEALPIVKQPGDLVTAGTINQSAPLTIAVQQVGAETALAKIVELVANAQARKAPLQKLADVAAGYFTYVVMSLAVLTFIGWYVIGTYWLTLPTAPILFSLKLAIAVLVIACPCALGLATPTAMLVGTGIGAQQGLLIKGGDILEQMNTLQTVVFDKTGTLTMGKPQVVTCQTNLANDAFWPLVAMAAAATTHPLAQSIANYAQEQGYVALTLATSTTVPGLGVMAHSTTGQTIVMGNPAWLTQQGIAIAPSWPLPDNQSLQTWVYVANDQQVIGLIGLVDQLRPEALRAVQDLQNLGLEIVLLTGDRPEIALDIAQQLGISHIYADCRPAHKAEIITQLQKTGAVAMVGDGWNDAPALAQANVGMAINTGTDVAIEAADVILMRDQLTAVGQAIRLAQATTRKIHQNLFWAVIYNCLGIPVAAGLLFTWQITLSPAAAGALMAMSSISVVLNSLSLRWRLPAKS